MLYIIFAAVFAVVALHDHRAGTSAHAPRPWDGNATASSTHTTRAKHRQRPAPYRNPYQLKPYTRTELSAITGRATQQPHRPSNPLAHPAKACLIR